MAFLKTRTDSERQPSRGCKYLATHASDESADGAPRLERVQHLGLRRQLAVICVDIPAKQRLLPSSDCCDSQRSPHEFAQNVVTRIAATRFFQRAIVTRTAGQRGNTVSLRSAGARTMIQQRTARLRCVFSGRQARIHRSGSATCAAKLNSGDLEALTESESRRITCSIT